MPTKPADLPALPADDPLAEVVAEIDTSGLTIQELKFAMALLGGDTQRDAVLQACPENAHWSTAALAVKGCRWAAKPHVRDFIAEARKGGAQAASRTADAYLGEVVRVRELAISAEQFSAAARLIETEGRVTGHLGMPGGQGDAPPPLQPGEMIATFRARFGGEAARRAALRMGLLELAAPVTIEGEAGG